MGRLKTWKKAQRRKSFWEDIRDREKITFLVIIYNPDQINYFAKRTEFTA